MRVRVGLLGNPNNDWREDNSLKVLESLFVDDPIVKRYDDGYYLSASEIDCADDDPHGRWIEKATAILQLANGTARILAQYSGFQSATLDLTRKHGVKTQPHSQLTHISLMSVTNEGVDSQSASRIYGLSVSDPQVEEALRLLGRCGAAHEYFWYDLWGVWELMRENINTMLGPKSFKNWVKRYDQELGDHYNDFEYSANFGYPESRHAQSVTPQKPAANRMSYRDARRYISGLVFRWLNERAGLQLNQQKV